MAAAEANANLKAVADAESAKRRRPPACPLFAAALLFCGGILLQRYCYKPPVLYLLCALGFALCSAAALRWGSRRRGVLLAYSAAVLAFLPAGALLAAAHQSVHPASPSLLEYSGGEEITLTGYVARSGLQRAGTGVDLRERLDLAVESAQRKGEPARAVTGTARLTVYVPSSHRARAGGAQTDAAKLPLYAYGQRLRLRAKLRPPVNFRNPGDMDYVGWLHRQGVGVLGSAKSTTVAVLPGWSGSRVERIRWRLRQSVLDRVAALWQPPYTGLFQAMVLGERGLVEREQRLEFQRSGAYHLLVVSGMNVAVFAVFLLWLGRRLGARTEWVVLAALVLTLGYAWLTDLGAPILRSVLMILVYEFAAFYYRGRAPLNTVALAALALLVFNPESLFDPSFQLTFAAVVTIAGLVVPLLERTTLPLREAVVEVGNSGRDADLSPRQAQLRLDLRMVSAPLGRLVGQRASEWLVVQPVRLLVAFTELFVLSALMQIAVTLPNVWYFHRINPNALWTNMAALPLVGVLMPAAMLAVACSYLWHWIAAPLAMGFAHIAQWSMQGILVAVHWTGGAQVTDRRVAMPAIAAIAAVVLCYALSLMTARRRTALAAASLVLLTASAWLMVARPRGFAYRPHALEITAIDIGQGDSFLLVTPDGHTLLIDSGGLLWPRHGNLDIGEDVVSPYLWTRGVSRLDAAAFSHSDADHIGGMTAILRNFHPRELWYARSYPSPQQRSLLAAAERLGVRRVQRHRGAEFDFHGVRIAVLSPPADWPLTKRGKNDASMVLQVSYAGHTALLVGDIQKRMEKLLVQEAAEDGETLHADLLKVAHHGSNTSTCDPFLDAVRPEYAIVSSGIRNRFRHPRPEVIGRLAGHRVRTYRTDWFGPVTFYIDREGVHPWVAR
jgi:competence protein ComEC